MFMLIEFLYWYEATFAGKSTIEQIYILSVDYYLWIFWLYIFYFFLKEFILPTWLMWRQNLFLAKQKKILLAVDVPKKNEQSIIGMELALTQILGAHSTFNWSETWIEGRVQESMSLEIVSIDGYIQLLIRCPLKWRDLIESSIYGQYPDAEITETNDYVNTVPDMYPNDTHDMWGVEWSLDSNPCYPIRTYTEFEDKFNQLYVDPLAGLLSAMSKIGKGEQIWFQIRIKPLAVNWADAGGCKAELNKILGKEEKAKQSLLGKIVEAPFNIINEVSTQTLGAALFPTTASAAKKDEIPIMWKLTSHQTDRLKLMEQKMQKLAYGTKIRYGYFAEKAAMNKTRGVNSVIGAIKQLNAMGRNGFKPELRKTAPRAFYLFVDQRIAYRKRKATRALKKRDGDIGIKSFPLTVDELATLFHFPSMLMKVPMLKHTEVVKREAPTNLPFGEINVIEPGSATASAVQRLPSAEEQIPTAVEEVQYNFDYDSDEFEKRFAIDPEVIKIREKIKSSTTVAETIIPQKAEEMELEKIENNYQSSGLPVPRLPKVEAQPVDYASAEIHAEVESPTVEVMDFFVGPGAKIQSSQVKTQGQEVHTNPKIHIKRYDPDKDTPQNLPFI